MEKTYNYKPLCVCSRLITFTYNDEANTITDIKFTGGCNGNLKAISKLCNNMTPEEIIDKLDGNTCGMKATSCADQLAQAMKGVIKNETN